MKKIKILIVLSIISIIIQTQVLASSFELDAETDNNMIKKGEKFSIYLEITNIQSTTGINAIQGNIEYDHNILEFVRVENLNNWTINYNDNNNGKFLAILLSKGEKENRKVGKLFFKLKKNVKDNTTSIKIKNLKSSDSSEIICAADKEIIINLEDMQNLEQKERTSNNIKKEDNIDRNNNCIVTISTVCIIIGLISIGLYVTIKLRRKQG